MCEFCVKHGEGKRWYLQARNYSLDLIKNSTRFKDLMKWLMADPKDTRDEFSRLRRFLRLPIVGHVMSRMTTRKMKQIHFGQVLPLEEVKKVFDLVDAIYGFPCVCRRFLLGKDDERYCFGVGNFAGDLLGDVPSFGGGAQKLSAEEAYRLAEAFEKKGLVHTVWTLDTPFIIGVCSCRPGECMAMEMNNTLRTKVMFKAEGLFRIDPVKCIGCKKCLETCHFGAIEHLESKRKCRVNTYKCYGCGLCRRVCPAGAPRAVERPAHLQALSRF